MRMTNQRLSSTVGANGRPAERPRRLMKALHRVLRDNDGNSSLMERFDELTKLLYCRAFDEDCNGADVFHIDPCASDAAVARRLRSFFRALVRQKPELFPRRFGQIKLSDRGLREMAEHLAAAPTQRGEEDLKGLAYEDLIRNTFEKGDNQQFFTPRAIVEFMVEMLDWRRPGTLCDPACGTGGFLLYLDRFLHERGLRSRCQLVGFEIDPRLAWVAGMNLDMHGATSFAVHALAGAGSLGEAARSYFGTIDAIVTNPPFGSDVTDPAALRHFELGRGKTSRRRGALFIERCLDLLRPGGVLAMVIDDGVLSAPSNADVRALILGRSRPEAIVSLPDTAFMPYATVKASILFLRTRGGPKPRSERPTFFGRAEVVGRRLNGEPLLRLDSVTGKFVLDSDLPAILRASRGRVNDSSAEDTWFWATIPPADDPRLADDRHRLDWTYHHPARRRAALGLARSPYPLRSVRELSDERNEMMIPARDMPGEDLEYVGLAHIEANTGRFSPMVVNGSSLTSSVRCFRAGDILFARMRPELRKVCLAPAGMEDGVTSAECVVLTPRREAGMDAELLTLLLRSDLAYGQLIHLVTGIGRPRLNKAALLNVRLPCPPPAEQRRLLDRYRRAERASQTLLVKSARAGERSRTLMADARSRLVHDLLRRKKGAGTD